MECIKKKSNARCMHDEHVSVPYGLIHKICLNFCSEMQQINALALNLMLVLCTQSCRPRDALKNQRASFWICLISLAKVNTRLLTLYISFFNRTFKVLHIVKITFYFAFPVTPSISTSWSDEETKDLVSLWKRPDILKRLPSRDIRPYDNIANQLCEIWEREGRPQQRDGVEIKRKMTLMERVYRKLLVNTPNPSKKWQFFDDMKVIFRSSKAAPAASSSKSSKASAASSSKSSESDTVEIFFKNGNWGAKNNAAQRKSSLKLAKRESSFDDASEEEKRSGKLQDI